MVRFKELLQQEQQRFASAFTAHLLRFALSRDLGPAAAVAVDAIIEGSESKEFPLRSLIREVVLHESFVQGPVQSEAGK